MTARRPQKSGDHVPPPLPDIQDLLSRVRRQVDKAKTLEVKTGYIDIGIEEFKQIKVKGWRQYRYPYEQHALDDPQPFWDYDSDLDQAINELGILRQSLLIADADRRHQSKRPHPRLPQCQYLAYRPRSYQHRPIQR